MSLYYVFNECLILKVYTGRKSSELNVLIQLKGVFMKYEFIIPDMTCEHCVKDITQAILAAAPKAIVRADPATHWVTVQNVEDAQSMMMVIQAAGYSPRWV